MKTLGNANRDTFGYHTLWLLNKIAYLSMTTWALIIYHYFKLKVSDKGKELIVFWEVHRIWILHFDNFRPVLLVFFASDKIWLFLATFVAIIKIAQSIIVGFLYQNLALFGS